MKCRIVFILVAVLWTLTVAGQVNRATPQEEKELWKKLKKETGFKRVFKKYKEYRFEIIFTRIDRDLNGNVKLSNFHLGDSVS